MRPEIASANENKKRDTAVIQNNNVQTIFDLLPIAYANVIDLVGQKRNIRMLCHSGSESTLLSESCINLLGFKRKNTSFPAKGLAESDIAVRTAVQHHHSSFFLQPGWTLENSLLFFRPGLLEKSLLICWPGHWKNLLLFAGMAWLTGKIIFHLPTRGLGVYL